MNQIEKRVVVIELLKAGKKATQVIQSLKLPRLIVFDSI